MRPGFSEAMQTVVEIADVFSNSSAIEVLSGSVEAVNKILQWGTWILGSAISSIAGGNAHPLVNQYFADRGNGEDESTAWEELNTYYPSALSTFASAKFPLQEFKVDDLRVWFESAYGAYRLVGCDDSDGARRMEGRAIFEQIVIPKLHNVCFNGIGSNCVNGSATSTSTRLVTLTNNAWQDPLRGDHRPEFYQASENPSFMGARKLPYSSAPTFTIKSAGNGIKTVYFRVGNAAGLWSPVQSASIALAESTQLQITSFSLNNGSAATSSKTVTLNNVASGGPTEYLASENPDFTAASWRPYAISPSFTLGADSGIKTVYFKVRTGAVESSPASADILLNAPALAVPGLSSPANSASGHFSPVNLTWQAVGGATEYRVQATAEATFKTDSTGRTCLNCVLNEVLNVPSVSASAAGLISGATYRWRVRAGNFSQGALSDWSETRAFLLGTNPTNTNPSGIAYCVRASGGAPNPSVCRNNIVYTTIQAAADVASDGDEIRVADGTYTNGAASVVAVSRPIFISGGFSAGATAWTTSASGTSVVIDGQGARPSLTVNGPIQVTLKNLTLKNVGVNDTSGVVRVSGGTLRLTSGGSSNGAFNIAGGAAVEFPSGSHALGSGLAFVGAGTARVSGGAVTVDGNITAQHIVVSSGVLRVNRSASAQNVELSGGEVGGTGTLTSTGFVWTGGTMSGTGVTVIPVGATLAIRGAADKYLNARTLNNAGTVTWTGGNLNAYGTVINNQVGALFDAQSDAVLNRYCFTVPCPAATTFNNAGTFRKSVGTGTTTVGSLFAFNNSGTVDLQTGTLKINGNYSPGASSALSVRIGGLTAGTQFSQLQVGSKATFAGDLNVSLTGGYTPTSGRSFQVVTYGSRSGTFANITGLHIGNGLSFSPSYNTKELTLLVGTSAAIPTGTPTATGPPSGLTPTPTITEVSTASTTLTRTPTQTPTATVDGDVDLIADHIEVVQAVQDLKNSVRLVANKRTFVRLHVRANGNVADATARLQVVRGGGDTVLAPLNPGGRIIVQRSPNRAVLDQAFLFALPTTASMGTITLTGEVNPADSLRESSRANNTVSAVVSFEAVPNQYLVLYSVGYGDPANPIYPDDIEMNEMVFWLQKAFPLSHLQVVKRSYFAGPNLPSCGSVNSFLLAKRLWDRAYSPDLASNARYYGMVSDAGGFMRGCAVGIPAFVASGPTGPTGLYFAWDRDGLVRGARDGPHVGPVSRAILRRSIRRTVSVCRWANQPRAHGRTGDLRIRCRHAHHIPVGLEGRDDLLR